MRPPAQRSAVRTNRFGPSWLAGLLFYVGFAGTGVGMSLPGSVLPALLTHLALKDNEAGFFFFLGWFGTSIGALLVRRSRIGSTVVATALIAIGSLGLAYSTHYTCFLWMAIYGVGLGMAMTAMSLHQAALHAAHRSMELNRLNLIWALGALAGPSLGAHSLKVVSVRSIYSIISLFFAIIALWVLLCEREAPQADAETAATPRQWLIALWPLSILCIIFLPTGVESSMGAWIAAYVQRAHQEIATTVTAGSCFWFGLLLSRAVSSILLKNKRLERTLLIQSLLTVVAGMILLIMTTATAGILPGIFLIGFGLGPIYPTLLAIALEFSDATPIFFIAGLGSAFLPWFTGIVSAQTHSLRVGLAVPLIAALCMLALGIHVSRFSRANPSRSASAIPS